MLSVSTGHVWILSLAHSRREVSLSCQERGQRENIVSTSVQHSTIGLTTSHLVSGLPTHTNILRTTWSASTALAIGDSCRKKKEHRKTFNQRTAHVWRYRIVLKTLAIRTF